MNNFTHEIALEATTKSSRAGTVDTILQRRVHHETVSRLVFHSRNVQLINYEVAKRSGAPLQFVQHVSKAVQEQLLIIAEAGAARQFTPSFIMELRNKTVDDAQRAIVAHVDKINAHVIYMAAEKVKGEWGAKMIDQHEGELEFIRSNVAAPYWNYDTPARRRQRENPPRYAGTDDMLRSIRQQQSQ